MKNKLACLIKYSLNKKTKSKWFVVVNVLLAILIIAIANIDRIISLFGGDFANTTNIIVIDNVDLFDNFQNYFEINSKTLEKVNNYKVTKSSLSEEEQIKRITKNDIIVDIEKDEDNYIKARLTSFNQLSTITTQLISSTLKSIKDDYILTTTNLTKEEIAALNSNVNIEKNTTNPDVNTYKDVQYKDLISSGIITIFIIPFFIFITTLVQMLGAEINDEKSSRGMEIIISSVPAKIHFMAKIIASLTFVLLQFGLIFFYSIIGIIFRKLFASQAIGINNVVSSYISQIWHIVKTSGLIEVISHAALIIIILFIISFIAYSILAAVLASMTTNIDDYQQIQTPLMMLIMAGYFLAIMANAFEGALFIKIMAFVPFISVLLAPVLYLLGEMSLIGLASSTVIMLLFTIFLYYFGIRIYKVGILNYSSSNLWRKIYGSLKNKEYKNGKNYNK